MIRHKWIVKVRNTLAELAMQYGKQVETLNHIRLKEKLKQ